MLKICILCVSDKPIPAIYGGAVETLVQNIIDQNEIEKKFDITLVTISSKKIDYSKYQYTHFVKIPPFILKFNKIYWKIYGFLKKMFKIEIISPIQRFFEYFFLKYNMNKFDIIIEELDLKVIEKLHITDKKCKLIYHLHYKGEPNNINDKTFDYLMPISNFVADYWCKKTKRDNDSIFLLKNCIDIKKFNKKITLKEQEELKEKLKIPKDNKVAIFIGRIIPEKGVLEMIQSYEKSKIKNLSLIIIGSSNFKNSLITNYEKKVEEIIKKTNKNIIHLGYVDNSEIYKYLNIANFQIVPSIWEEPAGLILIEGQAAGLPIVATNIGGIPEYLNKDNGILVNSKGNFINNLSKAIEDMFYLIKRNNFNNISNEWLEEYSKKSYYKNFNEIIKSIIERK